MEKSPKSPKKVLQDNLFKAFYLNLFFYALLYVCLIWKEENRSHCIRTNFSAFFIYDSYYKLMPTKSLVLHPESFAFHNNNSCSTEKHIN